MIFLVAYFLVPPQDLVNYAQRVVRVMGAAALIETVQIVMAGQYSHAALDFWNIDSKTIAQKKSWPRRLHCFFYTSNNTKQHHDKCVKLLLMGFLCKPAF